MTETGKSSRWADRFLGFHEDGTVEIWPAEKHDQIARTPFERDVDRIKYTKEFRRLKDVTQVARSGESYLYHDRLSHSVKVAQVGRRMAEFLLRNLAVEELDPDGETGEFELSRRLSRGAELESLDDELLRQLNPDVVEAACLAHDMGHPPFGHVAEEELDVLLQDRTNEDFDRDDPTFPDGYEPDEDESGVQDVIDAFDEVAKANGEEPPGLRFEGNAQSFRILTRLGSHRETSTGLWLTLATLNGVLKYPYGRGEWTDQESDERDATGRTHEDFPSGKFGFYGTEAEAFRKIREGTELGNRRSLAGEIMDYADDLTYAIHDMTDFYKDGRLPLDRLLREIVEPREEFERGEVDELEAALGYDEVDEGTTTPSEVLKYWAAKAYQIADPIFGPYTGTRKQRDALEALTSHLVTVYLNEAYVPNGEDVSDGDLYFTISDENGVPHLVVSEKLEDHVDVLQELTRHYVLDDSALMGQQLGQRRLIRELFDALYEESDPETLERSALPEPYSEWLKDAADPGNETSDGEWRRMVGGTEYRDCRARVVADFIATTTEPQAIELHRRLTGSSPGSLQNRIVR